ncbi:MAG: type I glyceraldehyde-3-phosphate dehydrogenase [Candidatus Dojkabacteria bacterium]|nr:type I glyceraldehyde-3-phosphate dehydrogenase [Candidatus Dojkabacteria bacterium]
MVNIAINGFGRIGRLVFRVLVEQGLLGSKFNLVAINDLMDIHNLVYLLQFDSIHGKLPYKVNMDQHHSLVFLEDMKSVEFNVLQIKDHPTNLPWEKYNVDIVIEATGAFTKKKDAEGHIKAGARKVLITAPSDNDVKTFVFGVNHNEYNGENIVSNASCTTNCLASILYVLLKSDIGFEEGLMTTVHAYTASQSIVDAPSKKAFRDGRAGAINLIPASTGAAKTISSIFPELTNKITGMAVRSPVPNVSMLDLTFRTSKQTSLNKINLAMQEAAKTYLHNVLDYTEEEVVSTDFMHSPFSAIYDAKASLELNDHFFKIIAWYDNEWAYANRVVDLLKVISTI